MATRRRAWRRNTPGCTGKVENCVTTVFSAYVTAGGQVWADFDVYMSARWADDPLRRQGAGIPTDLEFATKPQLAVRQVERLMAARLHHHRRAPLARRRNLQDRQRRTRLGPVPDPQLQRRLPAHRPGRPCPTTL